MNFTRRFRQPARRFGVVAAALSLGAAGWLAIGTSGVASAATNCSLGSSGGNLVTCVSAANGSATASVTVVNQAKVLQLRLTLDSFLHSCSGYRTVASGGRITNQGASTGPAFWCAHTWRLNPNGTTTEIASVCV